MTDDIMLFRQNQKLQEENKKLRKLLGLSETEEIEKNRYIEQSLFNKSPSEDKVRLFMSLFKGRSDVFAMRWESKNGKSGYSPCCVNEWIAGLCKKPKIKCSECNYRRLSPFTEEIVYKHLAGDIVVGLYPLCKDESCHFIAVDFDKSNWHEDVSAFLRTCYLMSISAYVERSRSGNGAHVWIFFENPVPAKLARKMGFVLLTETMRLGGMTDLQSYDRLFPNQDIMPEGGFGNLIALPLQKNARKIGNTEFIDTDFQPYPDQWFILSTIKKVPEHTIRTVAEQYKENPEGSIGISEFISEQDDIKQTTMQLQTEVMQKRTEGIIQIVMMNQLYIAKKHLAPTMINRLVRLAAFKNPEFFKAQSIRMSTHDKPRIITCADNLPNSLVLPRGCFEEVCSNLSSFDYKYSIIDKRESGNNILCDFNGTLTKEQQLSINILLQHEIGVLSAPTGFGKTVLGAYMIAQRKTSTLILVHRQELMEQWRERLSAFLDLPIKQIGIIGAGKNKRTGNIDIAMLQSLNYRNEIKAYVKNYGQIIVDECHHISAFSFEQVMKRTTAKYIVGLTATPIRKDGHHPIIFMQCGPIRHKVKTKYHLDQYNTEHVVLPRITSLTIQVGFEKTEIHEIYAAIVAAKERNNMILQDIINALQKGCKPLLLTERIEHLSFFEESLKTQVKRLIIFKGGMGKKERNKQKELMKTDSPDESRLIIATGKYIGEGFDDPELDTLFITMPISWKGTLQQYVGRLHRNLANKKEVIVYDYADINIPVLKRMYEKRLAGYKALGYMIKNYGD